MGKLAIVRNPLVLIGLAVSAGSLYLAFDGLHWGDVGEALTGANVGLLALAVVLMLGGLYTRALRWSALLHPLRGFRQENLVGAMNVGYAFNNIMPLRVGELVRAYAFGEVERVSKVRTLSTIVVERALDTVTVVALLVVTLPFIDAPGWAKGPAIIVGVVFLALAVGLGVLSAARGRALTLVERIARLAPERFRARLMSAAASAIDGLAVLREPRALTLAVGWSFVSWLNSALLMFVTMRAFGLDLPFTAAMFVMAATALVMVAPSAPGYIGVFHATAIKALVEVFDAPEATAATFALVQHAILYLTPIAVAAVFLWRQRGAWREVRLLTFGRGAAATAPAAGEAGGLLDPLE